MVNLKKIRKENMVSQQKLADYLGVSRSTVAMWETGGSEPNNEMLAQIASFFKITVDELLGIKKEPNTVDGDRLLTKEEWDVISAYRASSKEIRDAVKRIVKP